MKIGPFLAEIWQEKHEILSQGTPQKIAGRLYWGRRLYWRTYGKPYSGCLSSCISEPSRFLTLMDIHVYYYQAVVLGFALFI